MKHTDRIAKRLFDLGASLAGLLLLCPLMLVVAVLVRGSSSGPVFFVQTRVGRWGRTFRCVKFRTMFMAAEAQGFVTTAADARITPVGRVLRRWKLDELPQLWNVLKGEMSFVGPRPDVPGYADRLQGDDRQVLELAPGITGPASLLFRDEEALLANVSDPKAFNDEVVYPAKVRVNREYLERWGFWRDVGYIIATVAPPLTARTGLDGHLGLSYAAFRRKMDCKSQPYRIPVSVEGDAGATRIGNYHE